MKRMQTLMCIVLALSLLLGLGLAGAQAESAGKIVVFQQKTEIYDQLVELAKTYQEETGVEVEVWPIAGDDYYQNLKTYMASESGPTVFTLNSASEIAEMSGYLADLSDLEVMGKVQENLIAMVDGKKTGVPMTAEGFGIIYNKDMVDPEAISTMDGLIAFIEEQKAAGVTGLGLSQEGYFLIGQILNFPFAVQDDPVAFCQQVFSGEVKLDDVPEFQEFAKLFVAIRENQVNPLEVTYDGNCGDFATGKTAAIHQGNWCYTMFSSYDIDFEMGMVGLPVGGSTAIAVGIPSYWFVNADASEEEQQLGKDFLDWLYTSETGTDYLMNKFGFLPVVDGMTSDKLDPISASGRCHRQRQHRGLDLQHRVARQRDHERPGARGRRVLHHRGD